MITVEWSELKNIVDSKDISIQYIELNDQYTLAVYDGSLGYSSILKKSDPKSNDQIDFEDNYKAKGNKKIGISEVSGVSDPKSMRARLVGIVNDSIPAGQTKDLDWQIPDLQWLGKSKQCYFDGVEYNTENANLGDTVTFQVVDKDGITYPAGTVLEEFATDWFITPNKKEMIRLYKAKLIVGMYIRIKYTSTGTINDVNFIFNIVRHLNEDKDI